MTLSLWAPGEARRVIASAVIAIVAVLVADGSARAEANKPVYERAQHYKDEALKLWERLVNIDSGTGDEDGLKAVSAIVTAELQKLGAQIETVPAKPAVGDNVVATFAGTGHGRIFLMAHMDTVFAKGTAAARPFRIKDGRAHGPGVSDNKGGIIAAVYVLKILQDLGFKNYGRITLLLNTNEETGSLGTRLLIEKLAKEHDASLNLESGRPNDGLVIWRKGSGAIKVEVKGRAAHAGVAPDSGRNAAMELAHQVLQLSQLGNREKGTTVNFTVFKAGDRKNVIPDYALAEGDVRALSSEEFDRVERELATTSQNKLIADTEVTTTLTRLFPIMPQTVELFRGRVQADARRPWPCRGKCPFARRVCRGGEHGAPALPAHADVDGIGTRQIELAPARRMSWAGSAASCVAFGSVLQAQAYPCRNYFIR